MTRIVIPVTDDRGVDSQLSDHFGRAPFFAVFDLNENWKIKSSMSVPNESEHFGGVGFPPDRILQLNPDAVITFGMGPRALGRLQDAKVAVMKANSSIVKDVISAYLKNQLEELTEGCHHALHR
ncbi:NifB/NifX family molybdenum-iron cluster-binding protein [Candidatus Bathyarchaeota archaeon]|nr:NifB/NifX family molybdenum-iron cluster-binding protein [Candidatus Bathyarchaeota archaeon]